MIKIKFIINETFPKSVIIVYTTNKINIINTNIIIILIINAGDTNTILQFKPPPFINL